MSLAPCPPPLADDLDIMVLDQPAHPFVAWCHHRYTRAEAGSALLTKPGVALPPGLIFGPFFRDLFPQVQAIDTVYCRDNDASPQAA